MRSKLSTIWRHNVESMMHPHRYAVRNVATVRSSLDNNNESGCMDYARGWAWQHYLLSQRLAARRLKRPDEEIMDDTILLLEHNPVYTLGRGADERNLTFLQDDAFQASRGKLSRHNRGKGSARLTLDNTTTANLLDDQGNESEAVDRLACVACPVLAPNQAPIFRVERGGEVTFHGPGQLVVYPMLDLTRDPFQMDLHWYLRMTEEVVIQTLLTYGIEGIRDNVNTGVWVNDRKICAVGVSASRWITTHGFALNVSPDLDYFDTSVIIPCGIEGKGVTSIARELQQKGANLEDEPVRVPAIKEIAETALDVMQDVFSIELQTGHPIT